MHSQVDVHDEFFLSALFGPGEKSQYIRSAFCAEMLQVSRESERQDKKAMMDDLADGLFV